jgi:hypothetical protein
MKPMFSTDSAVFTYLRAGCDLLKNVRIDCCGW